MFTSSCHAKQTTVSTVENAYAPAKLAQILEQLTTDPEIQHVDRTFAQLTTLHLGGAPLATVECTSPAAVAQAVRVLDDAHLPVLLVGGGSNLVVADGEVPVVAVLVRCTEVEIHPDSGIVHAQAGAIWDEVVEQSIAAGLAGIECLSGIPGTAGATPIQNVGAYGVEIADVLESVQLYERDTQQIHTVPAQDLDLAYRYSNLKFTNRAVVLGITLRLQPSDRSAPLRFGQLSDYLSQQHPQAADDATPAPWTPEQVRAAVLALRRSKGMVYDPDDHDTWSAGSFFTNPVVATELAESIAQRSTAPMPRFPAGAGQEKLSAAWLIDHAGFAKGYPGAEHPVRLSTKHTLALTNRGAARTQDLVALAREIQSGVQQAFGVELHPEPIWVGVTMQPTGSEVSE